MMFKPLLTHGRRLIGEAVPPLAMPDEVLVRGVPRPLKVRVHAKAKRMILRFDPRSGNGKLTLPPGTPASAAHTFLSQSARWIDTNAPDIARAGDQPHLDHLPLDGIDWRIVPTGRVRGTVTREADYTLRVPGMPHRIMPRLAGFLKSEAEQRLTPKALALSDVLGRRPSALRFRDPRSQWGSCSSSRVITLSWRVMMAPSEAQAYLVAHEVAHLAEMNHSRAFWRTVAELEPNWKAGQRALKAAEKRLMAISFD